MTTTSKLILQPPDPTKNELFQNKKEEYKFFYELWSRSGGYQAAVTNLRGLTASVGELNTLVGINTDDTVQQQINLKADTSDLGTMASQDKDNVDITGGSITDSTLSNNQITIPVGNSGTSANLGATLNVNTTAVGNVGAGEDTLITYTVPADSLYEDGYYLEIEAWGTVAANSNNKTIKLQFGTTTLLTTGAVAANSGNWWISSRIVRTGSAAEVIISKIISDNGLITDSATTTTGAENLTTALAVFCTGEGTANDDIIQTGLIVKWFKA